MSSYELLRIPGHSERHIRGFCCQLLDCPNLSKNLLLRWLGLQKVVNVTTQDLASVHDTNPAQEPELLHRLPQMRALPLTCSATDAERAIKRKAARSQSNSCSFEYTVKRKTTALGLI